jgi:hypothetical protein
LKALSASVRGRTPQASRHAPQNAVFVTDSAEYEVREGVCCSVRDRSTGTLRPNHSAIGMQLARVPERGQILHLVGDSFKVLMTSVLEEVRPTETVEARPQRASGVYLRIAPQPAQRSAQR